MESARLQSCDECADGSKDGGSTKSKSQHNETGWDDGWVKTGLFPLDLF